MDGRSVGMEDRIEEASKDVWSDKLQAECDFQSKKRDKRLIQARAEGCALDNEVEFPGFDGKALALARKQDAADRLNLKVKASKHQRLSRPVRASVVWSEHTLYKVLKTYSIQYHVMPMHLGSKSVAQSRPHNLAFFPCGIIASLVLVASWLPFILILVP